MAIKRAARCGAILIGFLILAGNLWQCARDLTSSGISSLEFSLSSGSLAVGEIDSIQFEVWDATAPVAGDTVAIATDGSFESTIVVAAGGPYSVRAYASGTGAGLLPGSEQRGILATGRRSGIELKPGEVSEPIDIELATAKPELEHVVGADGYHTLEVSWHPVSRATGYTLGWWLNNGESDYETGILDTSYTVEWDNSKHAGFLKAPGDSVYFRVQPHFSSDRAGVYSDSQWVTPAIWMDLPTLIATSPAAGSNVDADTVDLWLEFNREINDTLLVSNLQWLQDAGQYYVPVRFDSLQYKGDGLYRIVPERSSLLKGVTQSVILTSAIQDLENRPFDGDPQTEGLQSKTIEWSTTPYNPLSLLAMFPNPGSEDVDPQVVVKVKLNRTFNHATLSDLSCYLSDSEGAKVAATLSASADSIYLDPDEPLWYDTNYNLTINEQLMDALGRPFDYDPATEDPDSLTLPFTTASQPSGPVVTGMIPVADELVAPVDGFVTVMFNRAIDPATLVVNQSFICLRNGTVGIPGSLTAADGNQAVTFQPSQELNPDTDYLIRVTNTVADDDGNRLDQDRETTGYQPYSATFHTENPPRVAASDPAADAFEVEIEKTIDLTFSRPLDPDGLPNEAIQLLHGTERVTATQTLATDSLVISLSPSSALDYLTLYTVQVDTSLTAADGSRFDQLATTVGRQLYQGFFITEPESLHPRITGVTPADSSANVTVDNTIQVDFNLAMNAAGFDPMSSFMVEKIVGQERTKVAGQIELSPDLESAIFEPGSNLENATRYEVTVNSGVRSISGFELDQDSDIDGLQPFTSWFETSQETDPPYVLFSEPGNGESNVSLDQSVVLQFSEAMNPDSLAAAYSILGGGEPIAGSAELDDTGVFYTFTPETSLPAGVTCVVTVTTSARDLAGNRFDQNDETPELDPYQIAFFTEDDETSPQVTAMVPAAGSTTAGIGDSIRVTFSEPLDPSSVTATSFRVQKSSSGTVILGTTLLVENDSTILWIPPEDPVLEFATQYTVLADTTLTDIWANGLDQDPSATGRQLFSGSFTTDTEKVPPDLLALLPVVDLMPITAQPVLVFSEPMDEETLTPGTTVSLLRGGGTLVDFSLSMNDHGDSVTIVPTVQFINSSTYTLAVDTLATDLAGNHLDTDSLSPGAQGYSTMFTTELDQVGPYVISTVPDSGAVHLDPLETTDVRILFSEPLSTGTVHSGSVFINGEGTGPLPATLAIENNNQTVVLTPESALAEGEVFTLFISTSIRDQIDNKLDQDPDTEGDQGFNSSFSTGSRPVINWGSSLCPMGESTGVSFDASPSVDPDSNLFVGYPDSISSAVWFWGDGDSDSLTAPAGLIASHVYDLLDYNGCDSLDNDSDGSIDETGADGCDESYKVMLRLYDVYGHSRTDTTGVSFCAFLVRDSEPANGASGIAADANIILRFTRAVKQSTIDTSTIQITQNGGVAQTFVPTYSDGAKLLTINPTADLTAGVVCSLKVTTGVLSASDDTPIDQVLTEDGRQQFVIGFSIAE
jgi:methionine-rich copper-binding protein CopC